MKRMIMAILFAAAAQISTAMPKTDDTAKTENRKVDMHKMHMQKIRSELVMSDSQFEAFSPLYDEYRKTLHEVTAGHAKGEPKGGDDAAVLARLNGRLDRTIHVAMVRKEFVEKFGAVLTPRQIEKLYRLESARAAKHARKGDGKHFGNKHDGARPHGEMNGHRRGGVNRPGGNGHRPQGEGGHPGFGGRPAAPHHGGNQPAGGGK